MPLLFLQGKNTFVYEAKRACFWARRNMATGAAADGIFRCIYEGCISGCDAAVERRPYHRNCRCALHDKSRGSGCNHPRPKSKNVSYPMRRAWSEGCLVLAASNHSSPSSSPATAVLDAGRSQLGWCYGEDDDQVSLKI